MFFYEKLGFIETSLDLSSNQNQCQGAEEHSTAPGEIRDKNIVSRNEDRIIATVGLILIPRILPVYICRWRFFFLTQTLSISIIHRGPTIDFRRAHIFFLNGYFH